MAIVLLILGVVLGGLMGAIGQSTENTRRLETKNTLREIEEALYAFAQVQGRLPCPADADTAGAEDVTSPTTGTCGLYHGLLPNATLGLSGSINSNGFLEDPWGNPYRYSVATTTPNGSRYTGRNGITSIYNNALTQVVDTANMLDVCANTTCLPDPGAVLADIVPAVVVSMGKNWGNVATGSAEEQVNGYSPSPLGVYNITNTNTFVLTGYSEENFDDMLIWLSPHLLFGKLITAGKLP
jgi:type II secretory pathway pseudopilin PulG